MSGIVRVLVISVLGSDDVKPPELFEGAPEGRDDRAWLARRLTQAGLERRFELDLADVSQGDLCPSPGRYAAVVVGGSIHSINERRDWQLRTMDWLRDWRETGKPLLGICGGHQMVAVALGGEVAPMEKGPYAQTCALALTEDGRRHYLFDGCDGSPSVHLGHYDHVTRPPAGARVLATHESTIQAFDLGGDWITVQFHPEASASLMVRSWYGTLGELDGRYLPAPAGRRIIANFFTGTGLARHRT